MKETIKLFKSLVIAKKSRKKSSKEILIETIKRGFVFSPEVIANYSENELGQFTSIIEAELGLTPENLNSSFHKSWKKIKTAPMLQLVIEQITHYFTTYGFEELGCYDKDTVYIPNEKLNIPEVTEPLRLTQIKGITLDELSDKISNLLMSGVALKEETLGDLLYVIKHYDLEVDLELIKNKEFKMLMCKELNLIPRQPDEFLRLILYEITGSTLLIKNKKTIDAIKEYSENIIPKHFEAYINKYKLENLASIFNRFKPIFLALKNIPTMSPTINKIRRLTKKCHKPLPIDYLNDLTAMIGRGEKVLSEELQKALEKANIFRKIRLAYALKYRTKDVGSIMYRVRNGKSFAKEFSFQQKTNAENYLRKILESIANDLDVMGKKIFIPEYMHYTLPATEKQFVGPVPVGSYVSIKSDMIVGVYWENTENKIIDLDMSMQDFKTKIGWDANYRSEKCDVLFSGDITDAPNGATELHYIRRQLKNPYTYNVNYYNYSNDGVEVLIKLFVASEKISNMKENYMVDPNNILIKIPLKIKDKQNNMGLIVPTTNGTRFYFTQTSIGNGISAKKTEFMEHARQYLINSFENSIKLDNILVQAGAILVDKVEDADIDLTPENLEVDTILNLFI